MHDPEEDFEDPEGVAEDSDEEPDHSEYVPEDLDEEFSAWEYDDDDLEPDAAGAAPPAPEAASLTERLKRKHGTWPFLAALFGIAAKFKATLFFALGKFKFLLIILKLSKFASTLGSMVFMIYIYAQLFGWPFGVGVVLLILVHEMGHYITARRLELNVGVPIFIPFIGAFIAMKEMPRDAVVEAKVALGGPALGGMGAAVCFATYLVTGSDMILALAYFGFMLNLFNLIPLHPLDGGRAVSAISPWLWLLGIPLGVVAFLKFFNPLVLLMLVLGIVHLINHRRDTSPSYYDVKPAMRLAFAGVYFGLIAVFGVGMAYIHTLHAGYLPKP